MFSPRTFDPTTKNLDRGHVLTHPILEIHVLGKDPLLNQDQCS